MKEVVFMMDEIIADLKREEGFSSKPYKDHLGNLTIGYGFTNLTEREANLVLNMRVNSIHHKLLEHEWFRNLTEARQSVLIQMAFQLGISGLLNFKRMILALKGGLYNSAALEMRDSKWFQQTPHRVLRLMDRMSIGR